MPTRPTDEIALDRDLDRLHQVRESARAVHRRFEGVFGYETVERFLRESMDVLGDAPIQRWTPVLAEKFAADRLRALAKVERLVATDTPYVLFLCVQNAGRSQMAAAWLQHLAVPDGAEVFSGGSAPADGVNPTAIEVMAEVGVDLRGGYCKPWTDEIVGAADVVVTMGCGDACPVLPGKRYLDWPVEDPHGQDLDTVRRVRDDLRMRVEGLMDELGIPRRA